MTGMVKGKKKPLAMMMFFFFVYFTSYVTRSNFGAVLEGIRNATGYTKEALGVVTATGFITYGAGQLVSGYLGDRIKPKALLITGLLVSCAMNFLIPFMPSTSAMCVLWGVNGFAQAFMWPPLVKLMAGLFDKENYDKAVVFTSWGGMVGTIANYLISFFWVAVLNWKYVFFTSTLIGVVMAILLIFICPSVQLSVSQKNKQVEISTGKNDKKWFSLTVAIIMFCIILQGSLRDGIATWMPTFINGEFNLGESIAILSGVLMPILGIVSFVIASGLYATKFKNPLVCTTIFFIPASLCALFLIIPVVFSVNVGAIPTIIAMAILNGCTHGINMMLVAMVPRFFTYTGKVSLISGILNAFTYIGSAISIYGYPLIEQASGLGMVKIVWVITAVVAMVLCIIVAKPFKKKYMDKNK